MIDRLARLAGRNGTPADNLPGAIAILEEVAEALCEGFVLYDASDRLVLCNERYREIYAISSDAFVQGNSFEDIIRTGVERGQYPEAIGKESEWTAHRLWQHRNPSGPIEQRLPDGRWLRIVEYKTPSGWIAGLRIDITELKNAEQSARRREQRYRDLVERTKVVTCSYQVGDGAYTYLAPQAAELLGYSLCELTRRQFWFDHMHTEDRAEVQRMAATMAKNLHGYDIEYRMIRADGQVVWIRDVVAVDAHADGTATAHSVLIDITEQKRAEAAKRALEGQLVQAQKMDALGRLTGGVAHDFNNLLTAITLSLQLLQSSRGNEGPEGEWVDTALHAAARAGELTHRLLAFSRRQVLLPQILDPNKLILSMEVLLQRTLTEAIAIKTALTADVWPTAVDPGQLETALLNLAINARDAMPEGGELVIETANVTLGESDVRRHPDVSVGDYIMLAVRDTGTGMSRETVEQAFEPFYTTKEVGKGTGLGLSMIHGFVKQSNGHISIWSELDVGTTVELYLPRATGQAEKAAEPSTEKRHDQGEAVGRETILVVEDNADVRRTAVALLEKLGYRVLQAADATAALALVDSHAEVDLLFTDIVMPGGMNGLTLAQRVRKRRPDIKVLYTSGHAERAIADLGSIGDGSRWIAKPYQVKQLASVIRQVLEAS